MYIFTPEHNQLIIIMKQSLFSFFIAMLVVLCPSCQDETIVSSKEEYNTTYISLEQAKENLNQLLNNLNYNSYSQSGKRLISESFEINLENNNSRSSETDISKNIYAVNFAENKGFALLASDERLPPLFILSDSGSIAPDEVITNPGVAIVLKRIEELAQIGVVPGGYDPNIVCPTIKYGKWEDIVHKSTCVVKWHQDYPYNICCPPYNNKHTLTGCVATAVAQLMSVYKYPEKSYNYVYNFDWDKMTSIPDAYWLDRNTKFQIAELMGELGLPEHLDMKYGIEEEGGSSSKSEYIPRTLKAFRYKKSGKLMDYDTDKIVEELKNGYPVLVSGQGLKTEHQKVLEFSVKSKYTGHQWLCHGLLERRRPAWYYDETGHVIKSETQIFYYPLCNWGWGGIQDGYYLSEVFDPKTGTPYGEDGKPVEPNDTAYNFDSYVKMIIDIRP